MSCKLFYTLVCASLFSLLAQPAMAQPSLLHYQKHYGSDWLSHYNTARQYHEMTRPRTSPGNNYSNSSTSGTADYRRAEQEEARKREQAKRTIELHFPSRTSLVLDAAPSPIKGYPSLSYVTKGRRWGVYDGRKLALGIEYDDMNIYNKNTVIVQRGKQFGVMALGGESRLPLGRYQKIEYSGKLFLVQAADGKFGVLNDNLVTKVNPSYAKGYIVYDNILLEGENGDRVLVNAAGEVVLHSAELTMLSSGLAFANIEGKYAFINPQTGKTSSPTLYEEMVYYYKNGFIWAKLDGQYQLLGRDGAPISSHKYDGLWLNEGDNLTYITTQGGKQGLLDISFEQTVTEMLPPLYDEIYGYDRIAGKAVVKIEGRTDTVSMKFLKGARGMSPFKGKISRIWDGKGYSFMNQSGRKYDGYFDQASIPILHDDLGYYTIVEKDGKKGFWFFDSHSNHMQNLVFEEVSEIFTDGIAAVKRGGKWGVVQQVKDTRYQGGTFSHVSHRNLPPEFEAIGLVSGQLIAVKKNGKWGGLGWPLYRGHTPDVVLSFDYSDIRVLDRDGASSIFYGSRGRSFHAYTQLGKVKMSSDKIYNTRSHYEKAKVVEAVQ